MTAITDLAKTLWKSGKFKKWTEAISAASAQLFPGPKKNIGGVKKTKKAKAKKSAPESNPSSGLRIFEKTGTVDRYTVILNGSVYGMSSNPQSASGVNQYYGEVSDGYGPPEGAKKISIKDIPPEVREAIAQLKRSNPSLQVGQTLKDASGKTLTIRDISDTTAFVRYADGKTAMIGIEKLEAMKRGNPEFIEFRGGTVKDASTAIRDVLLKPHNAGKMSIPDARKFLANKSWHRLYGKTRWIKAWSDLLAEGYIIRKPDGYYWADVIENPQHPSGKGLTVDIFESDYKKTIIIIGDGVPEVSEIKPGDRVYRLITKPDNPHDKKRLPRLEPWAGGIWAFGGKFAYSNDGRFHQITDRPIPIFDYAMHEEGKPQKRKNRTGAYGAKIPSKRKVALEKIFIDYAENGGDTGSATRAMLENGISLNAYNEAARRGLAVYEKKNTRTGETPRINPSIPGGSMRDPLSNIEIVGYGKDKNGNSIVKVSYPNDRAFSIQTNGNLPITHMELMSGGLGRKWHLLDKERLENHQYVIFSEIKDYIQKYGSDLQKKGLKVYQSKVRRNPSFPTDKGLARLADAAVVKYRNLDGRIATKTFNGSLLLATGDGRWLVIVPDKSLRPTSQQAPSAAKALYENFQHYEYDKAKGISLPIEKGFQHLGQMTAIEYDSDKMIYKSDRKQGPRNRAYIHDFDTPPDFYVIKGCPGYYVAGPMAKVVTEAGIEA